jgi:hypothetical protein
MEIILIHELRMPTARLGMTGFGEVEKTQMDDLQQPELRRNLWYWQID